MSAVYSFFMESYINGVFAISNFQQMECFLHTRAHANIRGQRSPNICYTSIRSVLIVLCFQHQLRTPKRHKLIRYYYTVNSKNETESISSELYFGYIALIMLIVQTYTTVIAMIDTNNNLGTITITHQPSMSYETADSLTSQGRIKRIIIQDY